MLAVTTPTPLPLPAVVRYATATVRSSLKNFPGAIYKIGAATGKGGYCKKTSPRLGTCTFYVVGHFNPQSLKLMRCDGFADVRNIGNGIEHRLRVTGCKTV